MIELKISIRPFLFVSWRSSSYIYFYSESNYFWM